MQELGIPSLRKLDAGVWTSGQPDAAQLRAARAAGSRDSRLPYVP
jgi:hypothetical protein